MYQGVRGIKELINLMLETNKKEYAAYGGPQKAHDILDDFFWENFHRRRIKKGIRAQLVFHSSLSWWAKDLNKKYKLTQVRTTNKGFEELTETIICGDRVAIIMYLDKPYGFLIEEKLAADSYKKFFKMIWDAA